MLLRFWPGPCRQCLYFRGLQWTNIKHNSSFSKKNYYQVLQVQPSSDSKQIKDNYYKLSKEFHPDVNKDDPIALARFKEVVEAYEVLSSPDEKQKYDDLYGFRPKPKAQFNRRVSRRFERGGLNEKGQFVDFEGPPEMRNIEYDLSPEKMEKIWKRYKERWDKTEEVERMKELKKRKIEFRRRIDERRANMANMTPAEREDFLFNLRMLRTDEGVTGRSDSEIKAAQKEKEAAQEEKEAAQETKEAAQEEKEAAQEKKEASQKENTASPKHNKNPFGAADNKSNEDDKKMHAENEDTSSKTKGAREFFKREKEKIDQNLNWKEELRQQIKDKLKEEGEKMRTGRDTAEQFARKHNIIHPENEEEQEKKVREEYRMYRDAMFDFGENDDEAKRKKTIDDHLNPKEDPFFRGMKLDDPESMKEWVNTSYERSKETIEEMKTSRPFNYYQQSVKHGVVRHHEVKWGTKLGIFAAILILSFFFIENKATINYDNHGVDLIEELRRKKREST